jgi:MFS family permease
MTGDAGKRLLPWLVAVAFFMESLDTTILNTAVPAIAQALKVAPLSMKAVLASYTLSLAVFIPISGWMADRFGTRRVFASAIGIFTIGSFLCGISSDIHVLVACRVLQGCGGAMMLPVGRLTIVRTFARSELIRAMSFVAIPGLIGPMLGPIAGGLIIGYFHWSIIFFVNIPIGLCGLYLVYRIPFLFPLLYQVGLGFTPIQSGLLMMPQALAAMSLKLTMPGILTRFGYRGVLISNTVMLGLMITLFATIGLATPVWLIVLEVFCFGFLTSLQYTSMNTLVYADVSREQTSSASTIASTMQQMSISFGVASASLAAAVFIPDRFHSSAPQMVHGIHQAFLVLGGLTILSAIVFSGLKSDDGDAVSQHKAILPAE